MASPLLLGALVLSETPLRLGGDVSVVDYTSGGAPGDFAQSLKATGFAVLTNHPIKYSLIEQVYDEWREFLTSGLADQAKYERSMETQDGYFSIRIILRPFSSTAIRACCAPAWCVSSS